MSTRRYYILHNGEPIPVVNRKLWLDWLHKQNMKEYVVASDRIGSSLLVTFFTGVRKREAPLALFTTCVFHGRQHGETRVSATQQEARKTHKQLKKELLSQKQ